MFKPNIFHLATKELSQDAFIVWLLQYADQDCKIFNPELHRCAQEFLRELIKSQYNDFNDDIVKVRAGRQLSNIDIWAEVNDDYFILIEDKINTGEHNNQLERYKNIARDLHNGFSNKKERKIVCIYIKTGDDTNLNILSVERQGYKVFGRTKLLDILEKYQNCVQNDIFYDFIERLVYLENENKKFEEINISEWEDSQWIGFYQFLEKQDELEKLDWGYVPNANGGFLGCWFSFLDFKYNTSIYLQIEPNKKDSLSFRVGVDADSNEERREIREEFLSLLLEFAEKTGLFEIYRSAYPRVGATMRFASIDTDKWLGSSKLDKQFVVKNLLKYQSFLKDFVQFYK